MLSATDTFLTYLSTELDSDPPVFWWRETQIEVHGGVLQNNTLNVQFLGFFEVGSIENCLVSLDLLATDERQAMTWLKRVRDVLIQRQFTEEMDYTFPLNPQPTGRAVSWEADQISFLHIRPRSGVRYVHYNATFPLVHTRE